MARDLNRGEIWLHSFKSPDKRRPVLVLSRQEVIGLVDTVIVASITSTRRGIPSEVAVGIDEGLKHDSVVNLDHLNTVDKHHLRQFVGTLGPVAMKRVCRALAIATGCAD